MNKLEEYKITQSERFSTPTKYTFYRMGFDTAIALNLPMKFTEWKDEESSCQYDSVPREYLFEGKRWRLDELYKYWIDNVYNPEES